MKPKIKVGSYVQWECKPYRENPFTCTGIVEKLKKSCFGGKRISTIGARICVETKQYLKYRGNHAFISLKNLTLLK